MVGILLAWIVSNSLSFDFSFSRFFVIILTIWPVLFERGRLEPNDKRSPTRSPIHVTMPVFVLPSSKGWTAEGTLAEKRITQIFNPRRGRGLNLRPSGWETKTSPTLPLPAAFTLRSVLTFGNYLVICSGTHQY